MLSLVTLLASLPTEAPADPDAAGLFETGPHRGLTLMVSGGTKGELTPCGCIWAARGGLARRTTIVRRWQSDGEGDEFIRVDLGNIQSNHPLTARVQNEALYEDLRRWGTNAVNVGADDAARGYAALREMADGTGAQLLSANLIYHDTGDPVFEPYLVVGGNGSPRVALVGLTRPERSLLLGGERNRTILVAEPAAVLERWLPVASMEAEHVVVLSDLRRHQANAVQRQFPSLRAVLAPSFNYQNPGIIDDAAGVLTFEFKGVQVLSFRIGPEGRTRAERLTLHDEVPEDPVTAAWIDPILDRMNETLRTGHRETVPDPLDARYVTAGKCASCHAGEHRTWSRGPHARAWDTLVETNREWTVACNVCHVTGAGDDDAWLDPARTPQLVGVQCESCHGPGREHADHPTSGYGADALSRCRACHTKLRSPGFFAEEAWLRISHGAPLPTGEADTAGSTDR
jgi:hypothetical protein